jgi:hypothetical protein
MARFFKKRSLVRKDQGSIHGGYEFALVGIEPEVKVNEKLIRHLAAKMKEPIRATGAGNEKLEVLTDHLMQEPEDFDEIRLPGSVCANEDVERPQIQGLVPDRLEAGYPDAVEAVHGIRSLASLWVVSNVADV